MSGVRSGFVALLAGVVVAGMVSVPPVAGTGVGLVGSAPQVTTVAPASRSAVVVPMAKKKQRPTVVFTSTLKLVVDVNPDLRGSKYWKVKLQRKSGNKWRTVGIYRTHGATETRAFGVKAGTYRVKVYAPARVPVGDHPGLPVHPHPADHATVPPTPPVAPVPPDTTAPGVVTGLAVVGRTATSITLAWTNPADPDLAAVIVRRAVGGTAPATPGDGVAVGLTSATAASVTDTGLAVDTGYAYAVFTRDTTGNTSAGVPLVTRTLGPAVMSTTRVSVRSDGGQASGGDSDDPGDQRRRPMDHLRLVRGRPGRQRHQRLRRRVPV